MEQLRITETNWICHKADSMLVASSIICIQLVNTTKTHCDKIELMILLNYL